MGAIRLKRGLIKPLGELTENCKNGVDDVQERFINIKLIYACVLSAQEESSLLRKLPSIPFESLLAFHTTEIVIFSFMLDLKFGCFFVQNRAANRVSRHCLVPHPCVRVAMLFRLGVCSSSLTRTPL